MNRIERMMAEVLLLQERGRTCEEIASALEVSRRTVMRDVQALCEMGVPVISRDGLGGGYSLSSHYTIQPLDLNWQEAMLLLMALDGLSKMSDSPFSSERQSLVAKLRHFIPDKHLEKLDSIRESVSFEIPERQMRAPMLDILVGIVGTGKWIAAEYDSSDGVTSRTIRPERLFADRGLWYLVGSDGQSSRTMRVDRVRSVDLTEPPSVVAEPLPYDHPSHPMVRVRLTRRGARIVERDPHMGCHLDSSVGSQVIEFRCPSSEFEWYSSFFGGMGSDAIVLEPKVLRLRIRGRALHLIGLYQEEFEDSSER